MSDMDNSVMILTPKLQKKGASLSKTRKKKLKKTYYESPLKHIRSSTKRYEQLRLEKKLTRDAKRAFEKQVRMLPDIRNEALQDSVIVLSDNESQSSGKEAQSKAERRAKKRPLELSVDNNNHNLECLHNPSKKQKKDETDPLAKGTNGNTKNSGIMTIVLDDEKIDDINRGTDEIVVIWSNTTISPELDNELQDGSITLEQEDVSFMIDRTPDLENLSCLTEEQIDLESEIKKRQEDNKRGFPSFSNFGLQLPKARNISGHIRMKKPQKHNRLQSKRKMPSFPQVFSTFPPYSTPAMFSRVPACAGTQFGAFDTSHDVNYDRDLISKDSDAINYRTVINACSNPAPKDDRALPPPDNNIMPLTEQNNKPCMRKQFPLSTSYIHGPGTVSCSSASQTSDPVALRPCRTHKSGKLRDIIIDGNNVAMKHKGGKMFSEEGLKLVVEYFQQRGHTVKVFLPQFRFSPLLEKWYAEGILVYTPSRRIGNTNRRITPYDDRYILEYATMCGGIVISSDQYRDLYAERPEWRDTIENRLMAPTFVGDYVMFPSDPLGRCGPTLETFLRH